MRPGAGRGRATPGVRRSQRCNDARAWHARAALSLAGKVNHRLMHAGYRTAGLGAAVGLMLAAPLAAQAGGVVKVQSQSQFQAALSRLRATGGTIELIPGRYPRRLVASGRFGGPLRIEAAKGARVQRLLLYRTRNVSVGPLEVEPLTGNARLRVRASRGINLHDLLVTAQGTRRSAAVDVPDSHWVAIRHSTFTHCGDRSPNWSNCLVLRSRSSHVTVADSRFHDCRGCDFIHGLVASHLTVERSRFDRTVPCRLRELDMRLTRRYLGKYAPVRCRHQDAIELFGGDDLRFEHNRFGVYKRGGAQLYLTGETDRVTIAHNLFVGTDPRVPGWRSRVGIVVGAGPGPIPRFVKILHNRIYTGSKRKDGYEASIAVSPGYHWRVRPAARPLIAHNVIGLLETPVRLCQGSLMVANVILRGHRCKRA